MIAKDATSEPPASADDVALQWRRTAVIVRALVPLASDAESVRNEIAARIGEPQAKSGIERLARKVAAEHRRKSGRIPFSDDLFRQLADSAPKSLDVASQRPQRLATIIGQLPSTERDLLRRKYALALSVEQIAVADGRPASVVARDLTILHGTLVNALLEVLPDGNPPPPGGAADLGRLSGQLLDGTISGDGRLVLETLLLGDSAAQAHYHRHVALAVELEWLFRGAPKAPEPPRPAPLQKLTRRELLVTSAFMLTCAAVAVFIFLLLTGRLRNWL
jgi:hypothetical protein